LTKDKYHYTTKEAPMGHLVQGGLKGGTGMGLSLIEHWVGPVYKARYFQVFG
jgi:hypothetical protein